MNKKFKYDCGRKLLLANAKHLYANAGVDTHVDEMGRYEVNNFGCYLYLNIHINDITDGNSEEEIRIDSNLIPDAPNIYLVLNSCHSDSI